MVNHPKRITFILHTIFVSFLLLLLASSGFSAEVTLNWSCSEDLRVTGYNLYYGDPDTDFKSSPNHIIDSPDSTSFVITGLAEGQDYAFAATSFDARGNESNFSGTIYHTIESSGTDPNDPDPGDDTGSGDDGTGDNGDTGEQDDENDSSNSEASILYAINCGGDQYTDASGLAYEADNHFLNGNTARTSNNIEGTEDDPVFQTERYGDFNYDIPIENGTYQITLQFAEIYWSNSGDRIFDVLVEDQPVVADFDIVEQAGSRYAAIEVTVPCQVSDGELNIEFSTDVDNAKISGIIITKQLNSTDEIQSLSAGLNENRTDLKDGSLSAPTYGEEILSYDSYPDSSDRSKENFKNLAAGVTGSRDDRSNPVNNSIEARHENENGYTLNQLEDFTIDFSEITINNQWQSFSFNKIFYEPVVVAGSMRLNDNDPGVVRIKNVTWEGFDIRTQGRDYPERSHADANTNYIAMEAGRYELQSGIQVEAGTFETKNSASVTFSHPFNYTPVVVCSVTTENGITAVAGKVYDITVDGFEFDLQEQQESMMGLYQIEEISFIAWEPSSDTVNGISYIVETTLNKKSHDPHAVTFYPAFERRPVFIADMQTRNANDPSNVRWQHKTTSGIEILIHEEPSRNPETRHQDEVLGYIAIESNDD